MKTIVIYKSKYGASKTYADWIGGELESPVYDAKSVTLDKLSQYDTIIFGGGLYAEMIAGISLITKNLDALKNKKIIIFTTGLTPPEIRDYYDDLVVNRNFKNGVPDNVKIFNFPGKMILSELSVPHKAAISALKLLMSKKENPTDMEKLLIELCDKSGDFCDKNLIHALTDYARN